LKALQAREKHVRNVLEEAQQKLNELTSDPSMYEKVLQKLLEQGLFQLVERNVTVRCREADEQLVRNTIPIASEEYQQATNRKVAVTLDTSNYLPREW
jgi:V-type H+-transporting ATPase subunit E